MIREHRHSELVLHLESLLFFGIILAMLQISVASAYAIQQTYSSSSDTSPGTLIIINPQSNETIHDIVHYIKANNGSVNLISLPNILVGKMNLKLRAKLEEEYSSEILFITSSSINQSTASQYQISGGILKFWNSKFETKIATASTDISPQPIFNDTRKATDDKFDPSIMAGPVVPTGTPSFQHTSEYMYGDIRLSIILMESNGETDTSSEDWTSNEKLDVEYEISQALDWWAARAPQNAEVSFYSEIKFRVPTQYEPITRPQSDEDLWIHDAMDYLNVDYDSDYQYRVRDYDNTLRGTNYDWAFTIFVVDSSMDTDGEFSDGFSAYAYPQGPFMVMTYDNDGDGIYNMRAVAAHEIGHIFGAADEYRGAPDCEDQTDCNVNHGFLNVENQNCEWNCDSNVVSIMRSHIPGYENNAVDYYAQGQIGWRDFDNDGVIDSIDANYNYNTNSDNDDVIDYWDDNDDNDDLLDVNDDCPIEYGSISNAGCPFNSPGEPCSSDNECSSGYCEGSSSYSARCCTSSPTTDGWYGGGNTQQATCGSQDNDASSDYRDYYCTSTGSSSYENTNNKDCDNQDSWYGGGDSSGCGNDASSNWYDYYVSPDTNACGYTTNCVGTNSKNCDSSDICSDTCNGNFVYSYKDYYVIPDTNSCDHNWGSYLETCQLSCQNGACSSNEICNNGIDDDADSWTDCDDGDCTQGSPSQNGFCCGSGCSSDGNIYCADASASGYTCTDGSCNAYSEACRNNQNSLLESILVCSETSLSCNDGSCESNFGAISQCDEGYPGDDFNSCTTGGQTYFADQCSSLCGGEDRGDNICRSSTFASGCTADSQCNGITAGTGDCTVACTHQTGLSSDGQPCTANSECQSAYCDNDGAGLSDDFWCFTPYNTYYDNQENTYCEYSTNTGIADCDEKQAGTDLNKCFGTSYYEDECSGSCNYQDITSRFECTESGCSCTQPKCDGLTTGSNIASCTSGQTYFADKCTSTAGGQDRTDNVCRSSSFTSGCTADSQCNGITAGTGNCTSICTYQSILKLDGESCTLDSECQSAYCDNDGAGLSDDFWCFTPYNTYFDGQEDTYCEYSTNKGIADCDEKQAGTDLNKCFGTSYYEDECSSYCYYQDITSRFECSESGCSCTQPKCDGLTTGSNIASCTSGQTYFADKCTSTAGGQDRTDNLCRSSSFTSGCTADSQCNGITAGTGGCNLNCKYVVPIINQIECGKFGDFMNCSNMGYNDILTGVRVNCTNSNPNLTSNIIEARFSLKNLDDNKTLFDNASAINIGDFWVADIADRYIRDSGNFILEGKCKNDNQNEAIAYERWNIPFGRLESYLISPDNSINVPQGRFFNFSTGVRCVDGECGDIAVILDPYGPDGNNYTAKISNESGADPFQWEEIITNNIGTPLWNGLTADDNYLSAPIGFSFKFYDANYTTVYVSSNGRIHFTSLNAGSTAFILPSNLFTLVAPVNNDMYVRPQTKVFYKMLEAPKRFIVEYKDLDHYSPSGNYLTYEIILYEDGKIKIQYNPSSGQYYQYRQIGINYNLTGNKYLLIGEDTPNSLKGKAVTFYPPNKTNEIPHETLLKGIVPVNSGFPFYTINQNPALCTNMQKGNTCHTTWSVRSTADGGSYDFFTIYKAATYQYSINESRTNTIAITIIPGNFPLITNIECQENNTLWQDCTNINYNDNLTKVRFNCTDIDGTIQEGKILFRNIDDNHNFFVGLADFDGDYFVYDNNDMAIKDSGKFALEGVCTDNDNLQSNKTINWSIPFGRLEPYLINLAADEDSLFVLSNRSFIFSSGVMCIGGECGNITAALDPEQPVLNKEPIPGVDALKVVLKEILLLNKGVIPMGSGTPFYTFDQNPTICANMLNGDSCNSTWRVNATGKINSSYNFFTKYTSQKYPLPEETTNDVSITILSPEITISYTQCEINGDFANCESMLYGDALSKIRVNCSSLNPSPNVLEAKVELVNIEDNKTFFDNIINSVNNLFEFDIGNIVIKDSGEFVLDVTCRDNEGASSNIIINWTVPFGSLESYLISPLDSKLVAINKFFNFSSGVKCVGGECGDVNVNFSISNISSAQNMKVVPMNPGIPFYTVDANPFICLSMSGGDSCNQTWRVNATGDIDSSYDFFTIYAPVNYPLSANETNKANITILQPRPTINSIECESNGSFSNCSKIIYNDRLDSIRVNCTPSILPESGITEVKIELKNLEDNKTFFDNLTAIKISGYFVFDNEDLIFKDSGNFEMTTECADNENNDVSTANWTIPFGILEPYLIYPTSDINATRNKFFNFSSGVRCIGGECGEVAAILDPYGPDGYNYSAFNSTENKQGSEFAWEEIITNNKGIPIMNNTRWDYSYFTIPINFTFKFYDKNYTTAYVNANGRIHFTTAGATSDYPYLPSDSYILVAPVNADMLVDAYYTRVFYKNYDNPKRFIVEYKNLYQVGHGNFLTYEVILYEDGRIKIQYNYSQSYSPYGKIGINYGYTGSKYLFIEDDAPNRHNAQAVTFYPPNYRFIKGTIPMYTGTPFYTTSQNPAICSNLLVEGSCNTTWSVNATGNIGSSYDFFTIYTPVNYPLSANETNKVNITIRQENRAPVLSQIQNITVNEAKTINITAQASDADNDILIYSINDTRFVQNNNSFIWKTNYTDAGTYMIKVTVSDGKLNDSKEFTVNVLNVNVAPVAGIIECLENSTIWQNCSGITYYDKLTKIRVNCTDIDGTINEAMVKLHNAEDNRTFFSAYANEESNYWVYDNDDTPIKDSGTFKLEAVCTDSDDANSTSAVSWSIPFGRLEPYLISPVKDINVTKNKFFNFSSGVKCIGGECGDVNVTLDPNQPVKIFYDGFESGIISNNWNTYSSNSYGRIQVTTANSPYNGTFHLTIDSNTIENYALNELITNIKLENYENIKLYFYHKEFGDEDETCPISWTNHFNGDCVAISCNGTEWYKTLDLTSAGGTSASYNQFSVNISKEAERCGGINSLFRIKFQQYDNYGIPSDGFAFDEILITGINQSKSIIPMNSGKPFYTLDQNPVICSDMGGNDVCEKSWTVNSTGDIGSFWDFLTVYQPITYTEVIENQTKTVNIGIVQQLTGSLNETQLFTIKNNKGSVVAWFGDTGNTAIKGVLEENSNYKSTGDEAFAIRNGGNDVFIITQNGNLYIDGRLYESQNIPVAKIRQEDFVIEENKVIRAMVNESGNLFLKGELLQHGNFSG